MSQRIIIFAVLLLLLGTQAARGEEKRVIIGFRKGAGVTEQEKNDRVLRAGGRVRRSHRLVNAVSAQLREDQVALLRRDPRVDYIEEDLIFSAEQPVAASAEYADSWGVERVGAAAAAQHGIKGAGVKVAILDSGIDYNHPDLKDNYRGGYNFSYDNNDPFDDSKLGHGTHVAGIIAAKDNGTGVVGVAPEASIYAVKVLNYAMMGSTSGILAGIEWAIANKMDVINMSFGIPNDPLFFSQAIKDACDQAYQAGIVVVAAAGNSNQPAVDFPADFDSVIAVAATAADDTLAPFSNYGAKVEVAAPGVSVKSTVPGGGYAPLSGTSQAAPHATGVVALLLSTGLKDADRNGTIVDEVRGRLAGEAHDLGSLGRDSSFGFGLVEAPRYFTVTRTQAPRQGDALSIKVKPGTHVIQLFNDGLSSVVIETPQGREEIALANNRSWKERGPKGELPIGVSFSYQAAEESALIFHPRGKKGASAHISISGN